MTSVEQHKSWSISLRHLLRVFVTSPLLVPNVFIKTLSSNTLILCSYEGPSLTNKWQKHCFVYFKFHSLLWQLGRQKTEYRRHWTKPNGSRHSRNLTCC
jgi:hypothetical protein